MARHRKRRNPTPLGWAAIAAVSAAVVSGAVYTFRKTKRAATLPPGTPDGPTPIEPWQPEPSTIDKVILPIVSYNSSASEKSAAFRPTGVDPGVGGTFALENRQHAMLGVSALPVDLVLSVSGDFEGIADVLPGPGASVVASSDRDVIVRVTQSSAPAVRFHAAQRWDDNGVSRMSSTQMRVDVVGPE